MYELHRRLARGVTIGSDSGLPSLRPCLRSLPVVPARRWCGRSEYSGGGGDSRIWSHVPKEENADSLRGKDGLGGGARGNASRTGSS